LWRGIVEKGDICKRSVSGGSFDPWEGNRSSDSEKTHPSSRVL
jgi:hypothetical protein